MLSQQNDKVWFDGLGRSYFARDAIGETEVVDTVSTKNSSNGYNLLDLNTHINPLENIEIFAQLRIRNTFGSFFGSGTSIDVRQLRAKGTIKNKVRFSIGDIFLKQSRFTLYNSNEDLFSQDESLFKSYRDIIDYENFYTDNRWRLQGLQTDFSFDFDRLIRTLEFDFFITRPSGSTQLTNSTYSSDVLLSGGSVVSKLNKEITLSGNYVNFFEVPSSGTTNISVRNPVYMMKLRHSKQVGNFKLNQKIQGGFSERHWLHSNLSGSLEDSTSNYLRGMFFEWSSELIKSDSSFNLLVGYRYVDPNFRSAAAQTRRLNLSTETANTIYPNFTNQGLIRPTSLFDLLTDPQLYNQELSSKLMYFNPAYANVLSYGDATPNRIGFFLKLNSYTKDQWLSLNLNSGFFKEVIGQGTAEKRNFALVKGNLKVNVQPLLNWEKELSLSFGSANEITLRSGDSLANLSLYTHQMNLFLNAEMLKKLFIQVKLRQLAANGNEFLTFRDDYGTINNFMLTNFNFSDRLISAGVFYEISKTVYANIQYNWWGMSFADQSYPSFKYQRLLFILSVKL